MSTALKLAVTPRTATGKALAALRESGMVPAVLYGREVAPVSLAVRALDFSRAYKTAGESSLIEIALDGQKPVNALIHDVAVHPLSGRVMHVDFYQVNMKEAIETDVPLEFIGESEAVKAMAGVLVRSLEEVKVKCLPSDLPHALQVNLAQLATFDDVIKIKDIALPKGVEMLDDLETVIATVAAPRSEAEMASLDEKVEMDVTKVEGVVKETPETVSAEGDKKEEKK